MTSAECDYLIAEFAARLAAERQLVLNAVVQKAALEWEPMDRAGVCAWLGISDRCLRSKIHRKELPEGFGGGKWWTRRGIIEWGGLKRKHQKRR